MDVKVSSSEWAGCKPLHYFYVGDGRVTLTPFTSIPADAAALIIDIIITIYICGP